MAVDYGSDLDYGEDLEPNGLLVTGMKLLGQAAFRRITTARGADLDSPNCGIDITEFLHQGMTTEERMAVPNLIRQEILDDERFLGCEVGLTETPTKDGLFWTISIRVEPDEAGPFELVCSIVDAIPKILSIQAA